EAVAPIGIGVSVDGVPVGFRDDELPARHRVESGEPFRSVGGAFLEAGGGQQFLRAGRALVRPRRAAGPREGRGEGPRLERAERHHDSSLGDGDIDHVAVDVTARGVWTSTPPAACPVRYAVGVTPVSRWNVVAK